MAETRSLLNFRTAMFREFESRILRQKSKSKTNFQNFGYIWVHKSKVLITTNGGYWKMMLQKSIENQRQMHTFPYYMYPAVYRSVDFPIQYRDYQNLEEIVICPYLQFAQKKNSQRYPWY